MQTVFCDHDERSLDQKENIYINLIFEEIHVGILDWSLRLKPSCSTGFTELIFFSYICLFISISGIIRPWSFSLIDFPSSWSATGIRNSPCAEQNYRSSPGASGHSAQRRKQHKAPSCNPLRAPSWGLVYYPQSNSKSTAKHMVMVPRGSPRSSHAGQKVTLSPWIAILLFPLAPTAIWPARMA